VAIVHDEPGVTRDRLYTRAFWGAHEFMIVDTGGVLTIPTDSNMGSDALAITSGGGLDAVTQALQEAAAAGLPALIEKQAAAAVEEASSVIFVVDGQVSSFPDTRVSRL
jgi:predicted GTPase